MSDSLSSVRPFRWRRLAWQAAALCACVALTSYFSFHTIAGRYGLQTRAQLSGRLIVLDFEAQSLALARSGLEADIARLSPEQPDPDIVAEVARDVLGFADPRDRIVRLR